jgi:hypothetical protein
MKKTEDEKSRDNVPLKASFCGRLCSCLCGRFDSPFFSYSFLCVFS